MKNKTPLFISLGLVAVAIFGGKVNLSRFSSSPAKPSTPSLVGNPFAEAVAPCLIGKPAKSNQRLAGLYLGISEAIRSDGEKQTPRLTDRTHLYDLEAWSLDYAFGADLRALYPDLLMVTNPFFEKFQTGGELSDAERAEAVTLFRQLSESIIAGA
tara:strand:- start:6976 stop:7443 length:468 start_codon:yes stop_codon:yes gene_type:complete